MKDAVKNKGSGTRAARTVVLICWSVVALDGFDLVVYGAVLPSLLDYAPWGLTPEHAGAIGSYALVGMLVGALASGDITDQIGRRRAILGCTVLFTLLTGACALAPNALTFGVFRLLAGVALGGVLPMAIALTIEYAPAGRRNFYSALTQMGYPTGGIIVSLSAILLLPAFGWRIMFGLGAVLGLILLPLIFCKLPESAEFLMTKGRVAEAEELAARYGLELAAPAERPTADRAAALKVLFSRKYMRATILFPVVGFFGLMLTYGLITWLPQILRGSGYNLGSALAFLLALNLGNIIGDITMSRMADRRGPRMTAGIGFGFAALCILGMALGLPSAVLYTLIVAAGLGVMGSMAVTIGFVGSYYPAAARATALGWSLGISRLGAISGPLLGGFLVGSDLGANASFVAFAIAASLASAFMWMMRQRPPVTESAETERQEVG